MRERAGTLDQLDGAQAGRRQRLGDLARLLVGVQVQHQVVVGAVLGDAAEPRLRDGAHGVGGGADRDERPVGRPQLQGLEPGQVRLDRRVAEPPLAGIGRTVEAAALVRRQQQHDADPDLLGRGADRLGERVRPVVRRAVGLVVHVVELADGGVARLAHLREAAPRDVADASRIEGAGGGVHGLAPRPEVVLGREVRDALDQAAQVALEAVRVDVDEAGRERGARQPDGVGRSVRGADQTLDGAVVRVDQHRQVAMDAGRVEHDLGHQRDGHVVIPGRSSPVARAWSSASS